ncbi:MAG: tol-pal system YbgF family protein [Bdellovibrionales bacterium]
MTLGWMQLYSSVRVSYNGLREYQVEIKQLHHELKQAEIAKEIESEHFLEFRQYVATLMPEVLKQRGQGEQGYPLRSLASTIAKTENETLRQAVAKSVFERGKDLFRKKEYAKAKKEFKRLIKDFGFSPYIAESYFLLAETYFQDDEFEDCVSTIQQMIELFPSHELTGFAMVRLGRVFEIQNRPEEAVDIYKTVIRSFPQRDVAGQAKNSLRGMTL